MGYSPSEELSSGVRFSIPIEGTSPGHRADTYMGNSELIGIDAYNAGQLAKELRLSKLIEENNKAKHPYQITERGKKYKANPPAEIEAAPPAEIKPSKHLPAASSTVKSTKESTKKGTEVSPPQPPPPDEKSKTEKGDLGIPSQADIFRSIAEHFQSRGSEGRDSPQRHNQLCS